MKPEPSRIDPVFSPRPWGARSLAPFFVLKMNLADPIGEAWLTSVDCRIATGPFAGATLGVAWNKMPAEWRGTALAAISAFPLLVKFIFPTDKLSIQVHPDDAYAAAHEAAAGGRGKTEMWHAVSARPEARLLLGLKPGTTREQFQAHLGSPSLEDCFQSYEVAPGDTFFVPAGTPHTIGPNMVICEVQEYSDLTYRIYDYGHLDPHGNPRELHIEKALEVMKFGPSSGGRVAAQFLPARNANRSLLAVSKYFETERWDISGACEIAPDNSRFELLVILDGNGSMQWNGGASEFHSGECWLIPADLEAYHLAPPGTASILRTWVPAGKR